MFFPMFIIQNIFMEEKKIKIKAEIEADGERIDKFLAAEFKDFSRSYLQKLLKEDQIKVNSKPISKSYQLKNGDLIEISSQKNSAELKAVAMDLDVIYEDQDLIVINKEADRVVHPAPGHNDDTVVNALLALADNLSTLNGQKRPGIVHRLDKDTSGLLIIAKNDKSHRELARQFKEREVGKYYQALIEGKLDYQKGKIDAPIGRDPSNRKKMAVRKRKSKRAVSRFKVLAEYDNYSLVEVKIETGRTHQIRVHFSYLGHPVVGDEKYGSQNKLKAKRQLLHAKKLVIKHPSSGEKISFEAELKDDFQEILNKLNK